jgi:hypothetical protein
VRQDFERGKVLEKRLMLTVQQGIDRLPSATGGRLQSFRVLVAFSVIASISMGFTLSILPITPGLDPSFIYAFNYAAVTGASWGREFISTYGPYGYLIQTMDMGNLVENKIIFNLLLVIASGLAAATYLQSVPGLRPVARVIMMPVLIYALSVQDQEYQWLVLFLLVFLLGLHLSEQKGLIAYGLASLLAGLFLLMKFSLGFGALTTLIFGCCLSKRRQIVVYRFAVATSASAVAFLIGWFSHNGTLAGISAYLVTGWEVSSGYSSAMSLTRHGWQIEVISFLVWFVLVALWVAIQPTARNLLTLAGLTVPLFVAWKHSVVRQDNHVLYLVGIGFFVVVILLIEIAPVWRWQRLLPIAGILLLPLGVVELHAAAGDPDAAAIIRAYSFRPFGLQGLRDLAKLGHFAAYREDLKLVSASSALRKSVLPESMRAVIGRSSVDVYPWEVSYVPANGLSWINRPLPASFNTYTPVLDSLNAAFFESSGRPEYLLWHTDIGVYSIDGRFLLWDEPRTLRAILNYYDMVTADSSVFLLRSRTQPRFGAPQPITTLIMPWNTWTPVPQTAGVILAEASITRPLIMRLIRALFREGPVTMSLRFSSGEEATYRLVPDNMGEGLWVSPHPVTVDELRSLFQGGPARRVIAVRLSGGLLSRLSSPIVVAWSQLRSLGTPDPVTGRLAH